jgi:nitroreductase/dihydropteridine reductase
MSLIDSLQWRHAAKRYNGQKVEQEKIDFILEAIRLSASGAGLQPYTVYVISDPEVKKKLQAASYNQAQIVECSHLLVFASWTKTTQQHIEAFFDNIIATRNVTAESQQAFKDYLTGGINAKSDEVQKISNAKQTYIALGSALVAAAELQVDATPMEGFVPEQYNEILGLNEKGLTASVIMALGYRSEEDWLAPLAKVRRDKKLLFEFV